MKRGWKSRPYSEHGFTLIESTLVVIVIGLLAIIAIPKIVSTDKHEVYIAARQIMADMRYARGLAIANAENYIVRFYPSGEGPTYYDRYAILLAADESVVKAMEIPEQVDCTIADGGGVDWDISFTRLGSAEDAGGDPIDGELMTLHKAGSHAQNINVISATGRVHRTE